MADAAGRRNSGGPGRRTSKNLRQAPFATPPPGVVADHDDDIKDLSEEQKRYLASWYVQTKDRMSYPKAKAVVAAHRFKNLIGKDVPADSARSIKKATPSRPKPDSPPIGPPQKLPYIHPDPELPNHWSSWDQEDDEQKTAAWQRDFAMRFLNKSWGDPYFAREVMLNVNERLVERQRRIARNKRQIEQLRIDHQLMRDYAAKLEEENNKLKESYIRGETIEDEPPPDLYQGLPYNERRILEQRKRLQDTYESLFEKQKIDRAVLEDYSRRLGGHLHRPDIEAIRRFVPTYHRYNNFQMRNDFDQLKERYFMLHSIVQQQENVLKQLEAQLKPNDERALKRLNELARKNEQETIRYNQRAQQYLNSKKLDPIMAYYQNRRTRIETDDLG